MVLLKSCCCWQSVRNGSLASGIYTMTYYSVTATATSFHLHTLVTHASADEVLVSFSIVMLVFAALSIFTSIVLIIGICTNKRAMLLPWLLVISMTTIFDVILSFYLILDSEVDPFFGVLFATDYFVCALNVYCILCVTSQFQEYTEARNRPRQPNDPEGLPAIRFEAPSSIRPNQSPARMATVSIIQHNGSPTSSICRPLLPSSGSPASRMPASSSLITSSSPVLMLSRSSFSSTSEISFYSSDLLTSSRRSSALPSQDGQKQGLSPVGEVIPFPSPSAETSIAIKEDETVENIEEDSAISVHLSKTSDSTQNVEDESKDNDKITPESSQTGARFRVSGVFSTMKSTPMMTKIDIPHLLEESDEDVENEDAQNSTS